MPMISMPLTRLACETLSAGTKIRLKWDFLACSAILMTPRIGRILPSNESSPAKRESAMSVGKSCRESTKMANAIGKSRLVPFFINSAGARLMVTFLSGKEKPELTRAERTRSLASLMVLLAMPTMLKAGRPLFISPSTSTSEPS